jgi:anti-sigma regulatory factor (Ser/Thr protein kinase)
MANEIIDAEAARLAALRRYRILDTEPERAFDDLTLVASVVCGTPIALISLIDAKRQWIKSRVGISVQSTARSVAMCAHTIQGRDLFVIPDALADDRFRENPLVAAEPRIRFYAGAPLVTPDGHAIGSLCVVDKVPRQLTQPQLEALHALKRQAEAQLELRSNLIELERALEERDRAERAQLELVERLRSALQDVGRLAALMPYCSTCRFNLVIAADPASINTVTEGVTQMLAGKGWSEDEIANVDLALHEALANAIRHGCLNDPAKRVQCCVSFDESGGITIVVRDPGEGFDLAGVPDPLAAENQLKPSGRGIFLINRLMDDVKFADRGRQLEMRRRQHPQQRASG